ncbi:MAG: hypothetical protein H5T69_17575 [Chloroflexi bacterium]|nr:hypothetical protein [Chloroflexota bacterium]
MTGRPEREVPRTLDAAVNRISRYANRGTFRQFFNEMVAKLAKEPDLSVELEGENVMVFYRVSKSGGFLGIGRKVSKTPVLKLTRQGADVLVAQEPLDEELAIRIASILKPH